MRRSAVLTASVALILGVSACGGKSEADKIAAIIVAYGKQPSLLCTQYATPAMIRRQFGNLGQCLNLASYPAARDPNVKVGSVKVNGRRATAIRTSGGISGRGPKSLIVLVSTRAGWRVDAVLPAR